MLSTVSMTLAPGCLKTTRIIAALCRCAHAALLGVLRAGDGVADVADANRRAVAIGDDDVVVVVGLGQLIVGGDGEALRRCR